MYVRGVWFAVIGLLVSGTVAHAQQNGTVTLDQMSKVLQDAGYRAETVPGKERPFIRTGLSGRRVGVFFYDCKGANCASFQYSVVFNKGDKFNVKFANEWNRKKRFAKAYLDGDGDMNFEWDVSVDGGVTPEFLKQSVLDFENLLGNFDKFEP